MIAVVEQRPAARLVEDDVGRVGDQPGEIGADRIGEGPARRLRVDGDGGAVGLAGLVHQRRAADAPRLDIDQRIDLRASGSRRTKARGAVEADIPRLR